MRRSLLALVIALIAVVAAGCGILDSLPIVGRGGSVPSTGRLVFLQEGNVWLLDLPSRSPTKLTDFAKDDYIAEPAASPDGSQMLFTRLIVPQDPRELAVLDLYAIDLASGQDRLFLGHGEPGVTLRSPAWSADGQWVYFVFQQTIMEGRQVTGEVIRIERIGADGSNRSVVRAGGLDPAPSPDGQWLAFVARDQQGANNVLEVAPLAGGDTRVLVPAGQFDEIIAPRFSPSGEEIVFAALSATQGTARVPLPDWPLGVALDLGPRPVAAHGLPWDVWVIRADGTNLRRLTSMPQDLPMPAWSPDGKHVAFGGELGLYVVAADGGQPTQLSEKYTSGVVWLR